MVARLLSSESMVLERYLNVKRVNEAIPLGRTVAEERVWKRPPSL